MALQPALLSPEGNQIRALSKALSRLMLGSLAPQYPTDVRRQVLEQSLEGSQSRETCIMARGNAPLINRLGIALRRAKPR
eukprot:5324286-Pyramimonas_sp.AAC.1